MKREREEITNGTRRGKCGALCAKNWLSNCMRLELFGVCMRCRNNSARTNDFDSGRRNSTRCIAIGKRTDRRITLNAKHRKNVKIRKNKKKLSQFISLTQLGLCFSLISLSDMNSFEMLPNVVGLLGLVFSSYRSYLLYAAIVFVVVSFLFANGPTLC